MKQTKFAKALALSTGVLVFSVSASYMIFAWTAPGSNPPNPNVDAPINTGTAAQGKLGNLGIGTISPTEKLELSSGSKIKFTDNGIIKSMDDNHALLFRRSENKIELREYGDIVFSSGATSGAETAKMILNSNGNLGIGTTSPGAKLHIANGTLKIETAANSWNWIEINRGGADIIYYGSDDNGRGIWSNGTRDVGIYTNGANRLMINGSSGNIGIGTTNPAGYKLAVVGSANISRDGTSECCSNGDFSLSLAENTQTTGKKAGIQFHNSGVAEGQLRLDAGTNGRELKAYGYQDDMDLHATGYVQGDKGLCIGNDCCNSWAECLGGGSPFVPVSGCTDPLPAGNKKIFVTSITYDVALVHAANFTYTTANADNACQARAAAAGLSGTYLALMYETVLSQLNNCNLITVLRYPTDVLPGAALWNGGKISGTNNCEWHLVATGANDMFSVNPDGNYLQNPIKYNEFGTLTDARVFTNFQPTGNGGYDRMNTCLQYSTCDYITGGAIRGCFYGYSTSKDLNWAGASSPLNGMGLCSTPCMDASSQKALYCVQQ